MWNRKLLKARAKEVLRTSYWKAFLVSLLLTVVGGNGTLPNLNLNFPDQNPTNNALVQSGNDLPLFAIILFLSIFSVIILCVIAFRIFLGYPLEVGGRRYFIQSAQKNVNMNYLGCIFEKGKYLDVIKAMLWRAFINFLWYLLLIIPGIIKSYAYRFVPYILADNPNIGYKRALELSKQMTDGHKFRMLILDFSFIGWFFLGMLAFFIGIIFVIPYVNTTQAELYLELRNNALNKGKCSYDELLFNPTL